MTIDAAAIERLTTTLTSDTPAPLTTDDRTLLLNALRALTASEMLIARQSQLLHSYQSDEAELDRTTAASLTRFAALLQGPDPAHAYDFAAASTARATLIRDTRHAESLHDFITAALKFAAAVTVLAG